jgi:class 3 adenylate cyclase
VNRILKERYNLPALRIGIGLAYSKALVTIIGTEDNLHAKAMGECVYRASKLSNGSNEIIIDEKLKILWPKRKGGSLSFKGLVNKHDFRSFLIQKNTTYESD